MPIEIRRPDCLFLLTGTRGSAESGIPAFCGSGGLWGEYRAEELATPEAFAVDPEPAWQFLLNNETG